MDDIIIRVLNGGAESIEERRLANWRAESSENERHFQEVSNIWEWTETDSKGREPESLPAPPSFQDVVRRGEAVQRRDVRLRFARGLWRKEIRPWAAAAMIAAVSVGVWIGRGDPDTREFVGTEYVADGADVTTVALADGSFVRLAPGSRVRFAERAGLRETWLSGRAFFAVDSDAERPFLVHTDLGEARVLGTRFEVASVEQEVTVLVVEGRVAVSATNGSATEVARGQIARLGADGDVRVETVENVYDLLDWPGGVLVFQSTPLPQVVEEVSAHFGVTVSVDDPALTSRTVTAWFGDETLDEVVESICLLVQVECEVGVDGARIGG